MASSNPSPSKQQKQQPAPPQPQGPQQPDLSMSGSAYAGAEEGVQGMLCADARGLCVQAKGVADPNAAGLFTALVRRAGALLAPGDDEAGDSAPPTVLIETERHNIIVKEYDDLTLAVYTAAGGRR